LGKASNTLLAQKRVEKTGKGERWSTNCREVRGKPNEKNSVKESAESGGSTPPKKQTHW